MGLMATLYQGVCRADASDRGQSAAPFEASVKDEVAPQGSGLSGKLPSELLQQRV